MREMKDSGVPWIGEIPKEWKILRTKNQYRSHKAIVGAEAEKYERLALTLGGVIKRSKEDSTGLQPDSFDGYQILQEGELVFKLIDLENLATSRVGYSPYTGIVSPAYVILHPKAGVNARFGEYFFLSLWYRAIFNSLGDNGVRSNLNATDLLNIPYVVPTLSEQQRIADFLDAKCAEIDSVLEKTKASIEEYKKLKQSVITEAVTKGVRGKRPMRYSGLEWIGEIPKDWDVLKNSLLFRENIRMPNPGAIPLSLSQEDGLIPTDEMKESALKTSTYDGWKQVHVDDLVLNRFKAHLGVFFSATLEGIVSFHYGVFEPRVAISSKYFEYLYHSDPYRAIYANKSNGMVVGLQNLSNQNFYSVKSLVPPLREQQEIAAYLDSKCAAIDALISSKEALVAELETYKKSLIYEYVTGKKEVPAVRNETTRLS